MGVGIFFSGQSLAYGMMSFIISFYFENIQKNIYNNILVNYQNHSPIECLQSFLQINHNRRTILLREVETLFLVNAFCTLHCP